MSISNPNTLLQNIPKRYLNPDGADVWFVFDGEQFPGHRFILASSPWLESMFSGSLTESGEINMSNSNLSPRTFKEFLRYVYTGKANLTMDNIREMMYLADKSLGSGNFRWMWIKTITKMKIQVMKCVTSMLFAPQMNVETSNLKNLSLWKE